MAKYSYDFKKRVVEDYINNKVLSNFFRKFMNPDVCKISREGSLYRIRRGASYPCISWHPIAC